MVSAGEPDGLKRVTVDVTFTIITCARCASRGRIDPLTTRSETTRPCTCGCDGFLMLCQVCGEPIGWGSMAGTIDLDDF